MGKFVRSLGYACRGIGVAFAAEQNFRIQVALLCLAAAVGIYVGLSSEQWIIVILSMGFVLAAELFNTAIERLGDEAANGKHNGLVKQAKDVSAAAVLLSSFVAFVIGIFLLIIPLVHKLFGPR